MSAYTGKYVAGAALVTAGARPVMTITYKAIGSGVTSGSTVIYTGDCRPSATFKWTVGGTVQTKYLPKS